MTADSDSLVGLDPGVQQAAGLVSGLVGCTAAAAVTRLCELAASLDRTVKSVAADIVSGRLRFT